MTNQSLRSACGRWGRARAVARALLLGIGASVALATFSPGAGTYSRAGSGASPDTGDAIYARAQEARTALRAKEWPRAAELYRGVVQSQPENGMQWEAYGVSLLYLERWDDAEDAFLNCVRVGYRIPISYYNLACAASRDGRVQDGVAYLRQAYEAGYVDEDLVQTDTDLDPLRSDAKFRDLTGTPDPSVTDRKERWHRDLAYLEQRLEQLHYNLYANVTAAELSAGFAAIASQIDELDDIQIRYEIQKALVKIGDGHTSVGIPRFQMIHGTGHASSPHGGAPSAAPPRIHPLETFWYDDGVFVRRISESFREIAGSRVLEIGGVPIDEALERLLGISSRDNEWGAKWIAMELLRTPDVLWALRLTQQRDEMELTIETPEGERKTVRIPAEPMHSLENLVSANAVAGTSRSADHDPQTSAAADAGDRLTRRRAEADQRQLPYWFEVLEQQKLVWVQIDQNRDAAEEPLADFTKRLMQAVTDNDVQYMAIDLRRNHGGSGGLTRPLLYALLGSETLNRPGHLYVLAGRETFSAAMVFAGELELHTAALFVGEPTGSRPNFVGETSLFTLPYSKVGLSCSSRFHQNGAPEDTRYWIPPDLPVPRMSAELHSPRDEGFETILRHVATVQ